jgi:hypothetical protein
MAECTEAERRLLDAIKAGRGIIASKQLINCEYAMTQRPIIDKMRELRRTADAAYVEWRALWATLVFPFDDVTAWEPVWDYCELKTDELLPNGKA